MGLREITLALLVTIPITAPAQGANECGNDGSVELLQFDGLAGRDFSDRARPPNLGVMLLRFPVGDAQRLAEALTESSATIVAPPRRLNVAPYGEQLVLVVRGPNGEWLEFFEQ